MMIQGIKLSYYLRTNLNNVIRLCPGVVKAKQNRRLSLQTSDIRSRELLIKRNDRPQ